MQLIYNGLMTVILANQPKEKMLLCNIISFLLIDPLEGSLEGPGTQRISRNNRPSVSGPHAPWNRPKGPLLLLVSLVRARFAA